mgnify:CR=1 FL=1
MIYFFLRVVLFCIVFFGFLFLLKKNMKLQHSKINILFCMFIASLTVILSIVYPIENYFCKIPTADKAFQYCSQGKIICQLDGKDSCVVAYKDFNSEISLKFLRKKESGYGVQSGLTHNVVYNGSWNRYSFYIYRCMQTNDYYIYVFGYTDDSENFYVTDQYGTEYLKVGVNRPTDNIVDYIAYIPNLQEDDYTIKINETEVRLLG